MQNQVFPCNVSENWHAPSRIVCPTPRRSLTLEFMEEGPIRMDLDDVSIHSANPASLDDLTVYEQTIESETPLRVSNPLVFDKKFRELEADGLFESRQFFF